MIDGLVPAIRPRFERTSPLATGQRLDREKSKMRRFHVVTSNAKKVIDRTVG
jgi:hypothetical protein